MSNPVDIGHVFWKRCRILLVRYHGLDVEPKGRLPVSPLPSTDTILTILRTFSDAALEDLLCILQYTLTHEDGRFPRSDAEVLYPFLLAELEKRGIPVEDDV
ncbi:hypothetical protein [Alicyclobacillus sp. SP_1]|uniref:hypothetical protein n=1 Tax=Alicyclobacillus sp. SP_1 TaxID=2942475 RepID=UPI0021586221|nr:hypothetical protein [Alicyclobacillus sp. SP_1]